MLLEQILKDIRFQTHKVRYLFALNIALQKYDPENFTRDRITLTPLKKKVVANRNHIDISSFISINKIYL